MVAPHARGRGVASSALRLLTEWGFEHGLERLELRISSDNEASMRVAERCGYLREGLLRSLHFKASKRSDMVVYSRLPTDRLTGRIGPRLRRANSVVQCRRACDNQDLLEVSHERLCRSAP